MRHGVYMNKQKFWVGTIEKQRKSGMSVEDWCAHYNIPVSRFLVWEERLSIEPSVTVGTVFKPVKLREASEKVTVIINDNTVTCDTKTLSQIMALLK